MDGIVYILTRYEKYIPIIKTSVESLKRQMPGVHVTALSEFPLDGPFDQVIRVRSHDYGGFYDKTRLMAESPYDRTIYLDCDIYVVRQFPELFSLLDRFDCALTHEEYVDTDWYQDYQRHDIPSSFPEFNTGVMVYGRSERMLHLLREWESLHRKSFAEKPGKKNDNDQWFFRAAAYYSDARIATLPREYNCKFRGQGYLHGPVKLLHGHVKFNMLPQHLEKANRVMNRELGPRVYIAGRVYKQETYGRLWSTQRGKNLGAFPLEHLPLWRLKLRRLRELGIKGVLGKVRS